MRKLSPEEQAYVDLADEMNDVNATEWWEPGETFESVFDARSRALGAKFAADNGLAWPPTTGDYDRWYERESNRRS